MTEHEGRFKHLPFVGGVMEDDEYTPLTKNYEYYAGHIPRSEFPDTVHVIFKRGWKGELQTEVSWDSIRPTTIVSVEDEGTGEHTESGE